MSVPSPQSPGQYYFKPMMKEFRFEPASQMITVEEGQSLSIDVTGIKTAYRYDEAVAPVSAPSRSRTPFKDIEIALDLQISASGFLAAATERCSL